VRGPVLVLSACFTDSYSHSPYPDVQASVSDTDEDLPVNTFRAWFLGVVGTIVLTALNQFFQLHNPPCKSRLMRAEDKR